MFSKLTQTKCGSKNKRIAITCIHRKRIYVGTKWKPKTKLIYSSVTDGYICFLLFLWLKISLVIGYNTRNIPEIF